MLLFQVWTDIKERNVLPPLYFYDLYMYTLQEYVPTGGGCFMFMACSTLYL